MCLIHDYNRLNKRPLHSSHGVIVGPNWLLLKIMQQALNTKCVSWYSGASFIQELQSSTIPPILYEHRLHLPTGSRSICHEARTHFLQRNLTYEMTPYTSYHIIIVMDSCHGKSE